MCSRCRTDWRLVLAVGIAAVLGGCERESRNFRESTPAIASVSPTTFAAGDGSVSMPTGSAEVYENNAFHVGEGKRYYEWYNCYSCHAAGGGDVGPPLMDEEWRYGGEFE